jgi:hypothetical protein
MYSEKEEEDERLFLPIFLIYDKLLPAEIRRVVKNKHSPINVLYLFVDEEED